MRKQYSNNQTEQPLAATVRLIVRPIQRCLSRLRQPAVGIIAGLVMLITVAQVSAQDGQNWLQAVVNEQVAVDVLRGNFIDGTHVPRLSGDFRSLTGEGFDLFVVGGDVLRAAESGTCSVVLLGSEEPLSIPPNGSDTLPLAGYCLELPTEAALPTRASNYLPINYGGQASQAVRDVLDRARAEQLSADFSTQLAVWQTNSGQTLNQLGELLNADLTVFEPYVIYLTSGGDLPPMPPPTADIVSIDIQPATAPEPETSTEPAADAGTILGVPRTLFFIMTALLGLLLAVSLAMLGLAMRNRNAMPGAVAPVQPSVAETPAAASAYSAPVPEKALNGTAPIATATNGRSAAAKPKTGQKCLICSSTEHSTRECPEIQRPNQAFMPTEVELTLANVDDLIKPPDSGSETDVPELDAFWNRDGGNGTSVHFLAPPTAVDPTVDNEFFEVAKLRSKLNAEQVTDTSPLMEDDESAETGPVARRHVTYVVREAGKADVIGSLGDDGGVISRISLKDSQILLPPKDVSTPHALLRLRPDGRVTVKDLRSRNGTFVGGERLEAGRQKRLQDGDQITFGDSAEFRLDLQQRKLISLNGNSITRDLNSADQWLITRRNLHSIVLPNNHLSSPHLLIRPSDDVASEIRMKDLHGHNPVLVDGDAPLAALEDGTFVGEDEILFTVGKKRYTITARSLKSVDKIGGRYDVVKQVYISKMADVYAVRDGQSGDNALLAAKILNIHQEKTQAARDAFNKEITLMQALDNPHLVPCIATGHDDAYDAPYYVMPFLDGSDMRRVLHWRRRHHATGALRLADIRAIFRATCSALEALHALNVAHCDLKPANIFITHQREIRLLDLGVVTPFGEHAEFFTQFYSAPEVGSKQLPPVSPASDIYSLGVLLLEMLTGIEAKDMSGHATEPAQDVSNTESSSLGHYTLENLSAWLTEVPSGADFLPLIMQATAQDSAERQQTIAAFGTAFEQALAGPAAQAQLASEGAEQNLAALSRQTDGV